MALKSLVKINQVSSLSDARYCAGMGVDILGFSLDQSSEAFISPEKFEEITQWVSGPMLAGEFENLDLETIRLATVDYNLGLIETTDSSLLEALRSLEIPLIYQSDIRNQKDLSTLRDLIAFGQDLLTYLHLKLKPNQVEKIQNELADINVPLILNITSTLENLDLVSNHGVSMTAHLETKTGLQDYGEIMDVLEALELDN